MSTQQDQTSTALSDYEIALFLQREKHRLQEKHHEFVDKAVLYLNPDRPLLSVFTGLTLKQCEYLHSLFDKLGGKIS